jgi:hypothetical protein
VPSLPFFLIPLPPPHPSPFALSFISFYFTQFLNSERATHNGACSSFTGRRRARAEEYIDFSQQLTDLSKYWLDGPSAAEELAVDTSTSAQGQELRATMTGPTYSFDVVSDSMWRGATETVIARIVQRLFNRQSVLSIYLPLSNKDALSARLGTLPTNRPFPSSQTAATEPSLNLICNWIRYAIIQSGYYPSPV